MIQLSQTPEKTFKITFTGTDKIKAVLQNSTYVNDCWANKIYERRPAAHKKPPVKRVLAECSVREINLDTQGHFTDIRFETYTGDVVTCEIRGMILLDMPEFTYFDVQSGPLINVRIIEFVNVLLSKLYQKYAETIKEHIEATVSVEDDNVIDDGNSIGDEVGDGSSSGVDDVAGDAGDVDPDVGQD